MSKLISDMIEDLENRINLSTIDITTANILLDVVEILAYLNAKDKEKQSKEVVE